MMSQGDDEEIQSEEESLDVRSPYDAPVKRSYSKSNMIYMNGYDDGGLCEEKVSGQDQLGYGQRNEIYLKRPVEDEHVREAYQGYEKEPRKQKMQ